MIRVLIASEIPAMRAGLRVLLESDRLLEIVAETAGDDDLLTAAHSAPADVAVLDVSTKSSGMQLLWRLRREAPSLPVLALLDPQEEGRTLSALQAGARGCLPRTASGPELVRAVRAAANGEMILSADTTAALLDRLYGENGAPENLTPRETEVLQEVAAGLTNKAVAYKLGISEHTVKFHLSSAMSKLSAASRTEAVAAAIRRGLIAV